MTPAPPPAPWTCRVRAVVWWHRALPAAREALPPGLRAAAGLPLTVAARVTYFDSPVGPYEELLAAPLLLRSAGAGRRASVRTSVPFIAVDSAASVAGGRAHWSLPKVLAEFDGAGSGAGTVRGPGWQVGLHATAYGPRLPVAGGLTLTQVGPDGRPLSARVRGRGVGRLARVDVDVDGVAWLRPGRHLGVQLRAARLRVGAPA